MPFHVLFLGENILFRWFFFFFFGYEVSNVVMCEPQVFGLRAGSSLPFFEISGFGRVRVGQNLLRTGGRAGIYVHTEP